MKKKIFIIIAIILLLAIGITGTLFIFTDVFKTPGQEQKSKQGESALVDKDTNKETVYSMEVLKWDEIKIDAVNNWIEGNKDKGTVDGDQVYYLLYNRSVDVLDMYLFMPSAKDTIGDISVSDIRVSMSGSALVLNVDTKNIKTHSKESTDLILHVYVTGNHAEATAKNGQLIIDGKTYNSGGSSYTRFE